MMRGFRRGLVLLATGTIMAGGFGAAVAQVRPGAVQPAGPDSGAELRRHLSTLASNPQSVDALVGAGRAALAMGDADAALTFFGRADEISPRHARVKAGMGSALVQVGQPQAALALFAEAVAFGAPPVELAGDRGLAFDLMGDPRRAQQEYLVALRRRDEPELRRRLALSLAISGQRDAALRLIDPQLRGHDRAAWRTQAFILALTGDSAGASRIAQGAMPGGGAQAMAPFFGRLPSLNAAQKAMAVHLGHFPGNGRPGVATASVDVSADPAALAFAGGGAQVAAGTRTAAAEPGSTASRTRAASSNRSAAVRRRPENNQDSSDPFGLRTSGRRLAPPVQRQRPQEQRVAQPTQQAEPRQTEIAEVNTRWAGAPYSGQQTSVDPAPVPTQSPSPAVVGPPAVPPPEVESRASVSTSGPEVEPPRSTAMPQTTEPSDETAGTVTVIPVQAPANPSRLDQAPPTPIAQSSSGAPSLADIAALVNALPQESSSRPASRQAEPVARTRSAEARATRPSTPAPTSRHWVQIAGGIERAALPREFARLRALAPEQLGRRTAFTAPMRSSSRLLVGPFASTREAQEFVNQLSRHDVSAFAWTSAAGQEIERLQTR